MFDADDFLIVTNIIKPLFKCDEDHVIDEVTKVIENLKKLRTLYPNNINIINSLRSFIPSCLLVQRNYKEYLNLTEPMQLKNSNLSVNSNRRLEICFQQEILFNPLDVLCLAGSRKNEIINENFNLFKDEFSKLFYELYPTNKDCYDFLLKEDKPYYTQYFQGLFFYDEPLLMMERFLLFRMEERCYFNDENVINEINKIARDAENRVRAILQIPLIGQGWVSETKLFNLIKNNFPNLNVIQHGKPLWLGKQHLDIWLPEYLIGIEYHGQQHFEPISFFGGEESFLKTKERDLRKIKLCKENNVKLFILDKNKDFNVFIDELSEYIKSLT